VLSASRILFIANGNGEDSIAAEIISRLPRGFAADAFPVVGEGKAYYTVCPIVGPRTQVPSQGWRHTKGSVIRDLRSGMLAGVLPAVKFLRSVKDQYDQVVVIGDNVGLILCALAGIKATVYLDVFKSGFAHSYAGPERLLIKRTSKTVFCRDAMLAKALQTSDIDARFAGNVMLDTVTYGAYDTVARRSTELAVTLLPGSRATTGESLAVQVEALARIPSSVPFDIFVAVANGVMPHALAQATGFAWQSPSTNEAADLGSLLGEGMILHLATGVAGNLIEAADVVLSQAGTATQQALGMGKPVVTFNRADNRKKRMADEQALMGDARILVGDDPGEVFDATLGLLTDEADRLRRGAIGRERLGPAGAAQKIVERLAEGV
jgi:uncharacterized protein (TIGR03492 family)